MSHVPRPASGLRARLPDVSRWSDADKVLLCSGLTLPFALFWLLRLRAIEADAALATYVNRAFLPYNVAFTFVQATGHAVLVGLALLRRRTPAPAAWLVQAEIHFWVACMSFSLWAIGPFTSPFSILLVALPVLGHVLFDARTMRSGMVTLVVGASAAILLPALGVIPYAPHMVRVPLENGELAPMWMVAFGLPSVFVAALAVIIHRSLLERLRARQADLERISSTDGLTGLWNRSVLFERLDEEIARARRHGHPLSVLMIDADHFKQVNDKHGHLVGDDVLRRFGAALRAALRAEDIPARYGGEEFMVLLPHIPLEDAHIVAQRLLKLARGITFGEGAQASTLTLSIGVAELLKDERADALVHRADAALYESKRDGRDRASLAA